jgi:hypothetical protein
MTCNYSALEKGVERNSLKSLSPGNNFIREKGKNAI